MHYPHTQQHMQSLEPSRITSRGSAGFTLIEALVAISILMIAVASPISISQKSLSTAVLSRDQMTASFLAQDAIEAVKNIRDQIAITSGEGSTDWLGRLQVDCGCTASDIACASFTPDIPWCNIDTTVANFSDADAIRVKGNAENPLRMTYTSAGNIFVKYDLSGTTLSRFSRFINVRLSDDNANEAVVNVRVSWQTPSGIQHIDVRNFIYNYAEHINP